MSNLNWVDDVILIVFFLSILAGLMRGLVREIISVLTWVAAFFVSIYFADPVANAVHATTAVSVGITAGVLFIGTIIAGAIINYIVGRIVEGQGISFTNRLLGGVFGLARGFLIILAAVFLVQLTAYAKEDYWDKSQLVHAMQPSAKWLQDKMEPRMAAIKDKMSETLNAVQQPKHDSDSSEHQP